MGKTFLKQGEKCSDLLVRYVDFGGLKKEHFLVDKSFIRAYYLS